MKYTYKKEYKELEIILSSFECDKHCPYCTAKITKWNKVDDDVETLGVYVQALKEKGCTFQYVTIGGNGEPTLHSYNKLKQIVEMFDDYQIPVKRVLTSGNVFRPSEELKYQLFKEHGWSFEVTTTTFDHKLDQQILGYNHNYFDTENFKTAKIRLNYVMLNRSYHLDGDNSYISDIKQFVNKYPNIEVVAIKILNANTRTGKNDNPLTNWIEMNSVRPSKTYEIVSALNERFTFSGHKFGVSSWELIDCRGDKHELHFSIKKGTYGLFDLVYYGNKFVDYTLSEQSMQGILDKLYFAHSFKKTILPAGGFSLADDFRAKLIGSEEKFTNYNEHSFILSDAGKPLFKYVGPFYNEKASNGVYTSDDCVRVVETENRLIEECNVFAIYLDETVSPGSITELVYASLLHKPSIIFYQIESSVTYSLQSSNWYPITFANQVNNENVHLIPVHGEDEVIQWFKSGNSI